MPKVKRPLESLDHEIAGKESCAIQCYPKPNGLLAMALLKRAPVRKTSFNLDFVHACGPTVLKPRITAAEN